MSNCFLYQSQANYYPLSFGARSKALETKAPSFEHETHASGSECTWKFARHVADVPPPLPPRLDRQSSGFWCVERPHVSSVSGVSVFAFDVDLFWHM